MSDWEIEKQKFIDQLANSDRMFDEIFRIDSDVLVIKGDERDELERLQEANKKILTKLQSREFTLAIVGMEKSGKSSLGNALIKSMVLPDYSERCTYTTTEIRSGNEDVATVYFYTREEFNTNFRRMLRDLKFPDEAEFSTLRPDVFERYWQSVEVDKSQEDFFKKHNLKTATDIKTMLRGKDRILSLLGQPPKQFGSEYWVGGDIVNEFKIYITGILEELPDAPVRRSPDPYAVKNIVIRSTQLADMSNMVIYDVPGFDSPTELHKRQTEEMLKESDAFIFVTGIGSNPNLRDAQLDTLSRGKDPDGIKLNEKAFVFGNRIDDAPDEKTARRNLAIIRDEATNGYRIALSGHVFGGCARAYLERIGKIEGNSSSSKIDSWNLEDGDGIDALKKKLQYYYNNDRFEVLKRRAEGTLNKTRTILQNLLDRYSSGELTKLDVVSAEILMDIQARVPQFSDEAKRIAQNHVAQIFADRPFTNSLKDDIKTIYPLVEEAYLDLVQSKELSLSIDPDGIYPAVAVDANLRDDIGKKFVENIVESVTKFTLEKQRELRQELVDAFLKIMGIEAATQYREELEKSVNQLFDDMLIKDGSACNFNSLVERFVSALIQTLITNPFAEYGRCDKVKETLAELVSLSVYYDMPTDKNDRDNIQLELIGKSGITFFEKILAHDGVKSEVEVDSSANENFLRNFFQENRDQIRKGADLAIDLLPLGKWAKLIMKAGINLQEMKSDRSVKDRDKLDSKLEDLFYTYDSKNNWTTMSADQRMKAIDSVIGDYAKSNPQQKSSNSGTLTDQLEEIQSRAQKSKCMRTKEDMISILDTDIEILRDITDKAVINAIGLERAFVSIVTKNVEIIRTKILKDDEGAKACRAWIRNNATKLMPSQFEQIIEQGAIRESQKSIVNAVKNVLDKWDV